MYIRVAQIREYSFWDNYDILVFSTWAKKYFSEAMRFLRK